MRKGDEKGYALVTVLLTMTIFMILALSFTGQSVNSQKQNILIEQKSQSVALAEMGIIYYQTAIENAYIQVKKEVMEQIRDDVTDNNLKENSFYTNMAFNKLKDEIDNIPTEINPIIDSPTDLFKINNISMTVSNTNGKDQILIPFTSAGMVKGKVSPLLKANLYFDFPTLSLNNGGDDENSKGTFPTFDEIRKPDSYCDYTREGPYYSNCNALVMDGSVPLKLGNGNNNNNITNKTIYSSDQLIFNGNNAMNMNNTKIHANGTIIINNNTKNISNSIIETKSGDIKIGQHLDLKESDMLIDGDLKVGKHLNLYQDSFVFINGNATMEKLNLNDTQSTFCITGTLIITNGSVPSTGVYTPNHPDFEKKCYRSSSNSPGLKWDLNQNIDIEYQY